MKKIIIALVILLLCFVGGYFVYQTRSSQTEELNRTVIAQENATKEKNLKEQQTDLEYIKQTIDRRLKEYYGVKEYSEILYQNKDDLLGYLQDITPSKLADGNVTVELKFSNIYDTTTKQAALDVAKLVMSLNKAQLKYLESITARFDTFLGKPYYLETANRGDV